MNKLTGLTAFVVFSMLFNIQVYSQKVPDNIDKIINNPELVKAIDDLARKNNRENKLKLMNELNEANYLVPVIADKIEESGKNSKGVINLDKDSDIKVLSMTDGKGSEYMPVFTDMESVDKWSADKEFKTIAMPAEKVWTFVLSKEYYDGVVVNPGIKALPLKKESVKFLKDQNK